MTLQKRDPHGIAKGSLADVARASGQTLAETFLSCDAVVVVDTSGSMHGEPYAEACRQLEALQESMPGKVAVVAFSDKAQFCPSGFPAYLGAGTDMRDALAFIKIADGTGLKLILISDGEPNDKAGTLALARTFISKIDTIFIGLEGSAGARFLRELSEATGGIATTQKTSELHKLGRTVRLMLEA